MSELVVLVGKSVAARVRADRAGKLSLEYADEWREAADSFSLSMNLRLSRAAYPQKSVLPYLWNLLPENPDVLQRWGQLYHVSAANPFKLLAHVGADVPGAVQFASPEQVDSLRAERKPKIEWITEEDLAARLRRLRDDIAAVRRPGDAGRLSLPGAQAKTAFYRDGTGRWGVPSGRTPNTHIIKPCVPGFDGLVEIEYLCQTLAARLGLVAARTSVLQLDEPYIVIERYDRLPARSGEMVERIHQEDICQALGLMPGKKYQEEGGPGIAQIVALLRRVSADAAEDINRFGLANIFNWLIGGTDAHAKNYSLLIGPSDETRLAPLYDLSSQLPYPDLIPQKLAMKIGNHYEHARIRRADWEMFATACDIEIEQVIAMITEMAHALPDEITAACDEALAAGLAKTPVTNLAAKLIGHSRERLASIVKMRRRP